MPTGYTAGIEDGNITTLRGFALRCARAFGACVMQKDDNPEDPPVVREPSTYHLRMLQESSHKLAELQLMTEDEAQVAADAEYQKEVGWVEIQHAEAEVIHQRYRAIREQVEGWKPPSDDHLALRQFMLDQIDFSMHSSTADFPALQAPSEWLQDNIAEAQRKVVYHEKEYQAEVERTVERNLWIRQLYESLPE